MSWGLGLEKTAGSRESRVESRETGDGRHALLPTWRLGLARSQKILGRNPTEMTVARLTANRHDSPSSFSHLSLPTYEGLPYSLSFSPRLRPMSASADIFIVASDIISAFPSSSTSLYTGLLRRTLRVQVKALHQAKWARTWKICIAFGQVYDKRSYVSCW